MLKWNKFIASSTEELINFIKRGQVLAILAIMILSGCSSKVEYRDVYIPVPQVCKFSLPTQPDINTSTIQSTLSSALELIYERQMLREQIRQIPCLDIIEE